MILVDHPNVLKAHCSFVSDHNLWVVMPFMAGGSCLHKLKAVHPDGFEKVVIATVLREILKGLEYLHDHGHIRREMSRTKCENCDDDASVRSSTHKPHVSQNSCPCIDGSIEGTMAGKRGVDVSRRREGSSGSIISPDACVLPGKDESGAQDLLVLDDAPTEILSGASKTLANSDELDEKAKPVVQLKGRFKVTSGNVNVEKVAPSPFLQKSHSVQVITQHPTGPLPSPADAVPPNLHSFFSMLQSVLETNIYERGKILSLMKQASACDFIVDGGCTPVNIAPIEKSLCSWRQLMTEKELLHGIADLRWRLICAQEELQKYKTQNPQV